MTFQEHTQSLLAYIDELTKDSLYGDLTIFCEDGEVQSHKVLLASCSSFVQECLLSPWDCDTLILPGVSTQDVTTFLSCIFTFRLSPSASQVDSVIKVLLALGVNVAPYVDVKADRVMDLSRKNGKETTKKPGLIVIPACLDVVKTDKQVEDSDKAKLKPSQEPTSFSLSYQINEKDEIVVGPKFSCEKCSMDFEIKEELEKHTKETCNDSNSTHFCESCKKAFSSSQTFNNHVKLHTKELKFKCEVCEKCYVSKSVLGNHMKTHDNSNKVPRFNCEHCQKVFNHPSNLKRHTRTAHFELSDKKLYDCNVCGKQYKDPSARNSHQKLHMEVRPHPCQVCNKTFISSYQLESHARIHSGDKPFGCNDCGRCFITKAQLKSHKQHKHATVKVKGVKSHLCQECGQRFVKEFDLKVHMRKHTGERPFKCECGKSFGSKRNFINHKRIHTGDKPYSCDTCHKTFSTCSGLRQHFKCHADCRINAAEGAYCLREKKAQRFGRDTLESIPELSMAAAAGLHNLESFTVAELKEEVSVAEETVVYFNADPELGIAGLEGVTIQALEMQEMEVSGGGGGQVLSLVQIDDGHL